MFVIDACVAINYLESDPEALSLFSKHIGRLYMVDLVKGEIKGQTDENLGKLNIQIYESSLEDLSSAHSQKGPLSPADNLCWMTAKKENYSCITDDKALIRQCEALSINFLRSLRLLLTLKRENIIDSFRALHAAKQICDKNPYLGETVFQQFNREIENLPLID